MSKETYVLHTHTCVQYIVSASVHKISVIQLVDRGPLTVCIFVAQLENC
jgi:hypothetical protein